MKKKEEISESYAAYVRRQFVKHKLGLTSLVLVAALCVVALFADFLANDKPIVASLNGSLRMPILKSYVVSLGLTQWSNDEKQINWSTAPYEWSVFPPVPYSVSNYDKSVIKERDRSPSSKHWFGTDDLSRDILCGMIHGSRYALSIGFISMAIALTIGIGLGAIAGYFGGVVDIIISRLIEIFISMPLLFLIITVVAMMQDIVQAEGRLPLIMSVIGFTSWTSIARLIRAEVLRVRNLDFIASAQALGYSTGRIIIRHVLPNSIGPVLVSAAFGIASAILIESTLSFLGFGVPSTVITWGSLLARSRGFINMWWLAFFPGVMIFLTVSAYNLIGDALRDATDPRLRA